MNKQHTNLMYLALIAGALVESLFSPYLSVANAQSPMDQMSTMNGNETAMSQNITMPKLNMGVVTMPVVCTSLGEILGSVAGLTSGGGNETQDGVMDLMQMLTSGGVLNMTEADTQEMRNMTEGVDLQQLMNMQFCSLVTDEKMMEEMMEEMQ